MEQQNSVTCFIVSVEFPLFLLLSFPEIVCHFGFVALLKLIHLLSNCIFLDTSKPAALLIAHDILDVPINVADRLYYCPLADAVTLLEFPYSVWVVFMEKKIFVAAL